MSLLQWDRNLLVSINSHHSEFWDGFMWLATDEMSWLAFFAALLWLIYKQKGKEIIFVIIAIALTVLICDQVSGFFKDWIARPRPSREVGLRDTLHIVNDYRGGRYGFFSSHAANTFGIAVLVAFLMRHWLITLILITWASIESYTRLYLGVHYPLDILTGIVFGSLSGYGIYRLEVYICRFFKLHVGQRIATNQVLFLFIIFLTTLYMMLFAAKNIPDFLL